MTEYIMNIDKALYDPDTGAAVFKPEFRGELVRCRECQWFDLTHPYGTVIPDAYHCKTNDRFYSETHFCGYGERRK